MRQVIWAYLVGMGLVAGPAWAAEPDPRPTFAGPPPAEEMKVFEPLVGRWTTEIAVRPSVRTKEAFTSKGEVTGQWLHNGHFLRLEGSAQSRQGRFEYTALFSYDRTNKEYRRFVFTTDGITAVSTGEWDEKTKTMTWRATGLPAGVMFQVKTVIGPDQFSETLLGKNQAGTILMDSTSTATRKKPADK